MTYVDADATNTTLAGGGALVTGGGAGQWHLRTGDGNGGTVLASADVVAEDAPTIKTTATVPAPGIYDLWVNFWGNPIGGDWRITAGTATNQMQIFRQMACKVVQPADSDSVLVLTNASTNFLYQAYVGRVTASDSNTVSVFVDDNAVVVGMTSMLAGNTNRTWYDGISFAKVNPLQVQNVSATPSAATLIWNSIPPQNSLTTPTYSVQKKNSLSDVNWMTVASGILSGGSTTTNVDHSATGSAAFYRITMP